MKVYFDADGSLTVEGEDATEWLALRTWADTWSAGSVPLWVRTKDYDTGSDEPYRRPVPSLRQLFKAESLEPADRIKAAERERCAIPGPGSPEASAMIDSVLAEYGWPANAKNAARAGFVAAQRLMKA